VKVDFFGSHDLAAIILGHSGDLLPFFGFKLSFYFGLEFEDARFLYE
jgi:hypothetical protein